LTFLQTDKGTWDRPVDRDGCTSLPVQSKGPFADLQIDQFATERRNVPTGMSDGWQRMDRAGGKERLERSKQPQRSRPLEQKASGYHLVIHL
jgi:hypothetical protein